MSCATKSFRWLRYGPATAPPTHGQGNIPALRLVVSNDDSEPPIRSAPDPTAAAPERIAELHERRTRGFEAIEEAVRKLEEDSFFEQPATTVQMAA